MQTFQLFHFFFSLLATNLLTSALSRIDRNTSSSVRTFISLQNITDQPFSPESDRHSKGHCDGKHASYDKRWFGIDLAPNSAQVSRDQIRLPWPRVGRFSGAAQPVRYCFRDRRSADNLQEVLQEAITKFNPATAHSSLHFTLDPACAGNPHVYCTDRRVGADALVITDITRNGDDDWNWEQCETLSTTGYDYHSNVRGRHQIVFCDYIPDDRDRTYYYAVKSMTHELGHVIGLQHEHQRPDRDSYLKFDCKAVEGYREAQRRVDIDEQCLWDEDEDGYEPDLRTKMRMVCNDQEFATAYFPQVLPFLKSNQMDNERWQSYVQSHQFDYDSIMIYDSFPNGNPSTVHKPRFLRRDTRQPVYMGANMGRPQRTRLSAGDIARVAQLYPLNNHAGNRAMRLREWASANRAGKRQAQNSTREDEIAQNKTGNSIWDKLFSAACLIRVLSC